MDHRAALDLLDAHESTLLDLQLQAYRDFDDTHADGTLKVSVEASRPKWVNTRVNHLLEMHFGTIGPVRLQTDGQLKFLFIEGDDFNLGVRAKKVDANWRSCNHDSGQQDFLRQDGHFPGWNVPTYHLVLGYRQTEGLQPAISHVGITWERQSVEMIRLLWTKSEGVIAFPVEIQESLKDQTQATQPAPPKLRRRKSDDAADGRGNRKQG